MLICFYELNSKNKLRVCALRSENVDLGLLFVKMVSVVTPFQILLDHTESQVENLINSRVEDVYLTAYMPLVLFIR